MSSTVPVPVPSAMELESRRRHPSMRSGVSNLRLQARVSASLDRGGTAQADVAVAVMSARGRSGLSSEVFSARLGVDLAVLAAAEAGELARDELPGPIRRLVPQTA